MPLYKKNPAWRRNPRKLARALAAILAQNERDRAAAAVDSATARYEEIKEGRTDGRVE